MKGRWRMMSIDAVSWRCVDVDSEWRRAPGVDGDSGMERSENLWFGGGQNGKSRRLPSRLYRRQSAGVSGSQRAINQGPVDPPRLECIHLFSRSFCASDPKTLTGPFALAVPRTFQLSRIEEECQASRRISVGEVGLQPYSYAGNAGAPYRRRCVSGAYRDDNHCNQPLGWERERKILPFHAQ